MESGPVAAAVRDGLHTAATSNRLLPPPTRPPMPRLRVAAAADTAPAAGPHPVLDAAARGNRRPDRSHRRPGTTTSTPAAADRRRAVTHQAASRANDPFGDLPPNPAQSATPTEYPPILQQSQPAQVRAVRRRASGRLLVHAGQQRLEHNQQTPAAHHGSPA